MARAANVRKTWNEPAPTTRPTLRAVSPTAVETDIKANPVRPAVGVHHVVIALAMIGVAAFLLAIPFFFSADPSENLDLLGIVGFAVIFFTLTLGLANRAAHERRWGGGDKESFEEFIEDNVATATGTVSSREALVQILTLPATLAIGMWAIALIFAFSK